MIARASQLFLPTLREAPAEAETANHRLLVRGGFVRQVTGGVWTFLPLGWRVHRKVEQIIREEMDHAGAEEVHLPAIHPIELWEESGRKNAMGDVLFQLTDRRGRGLALGPTHDPREVGRVDIRVTRHHGILFVVSQFDRGCPETHEGNVSLRLQH